MSSYSATMIVKSLNGDTMAACGSFGNIDIDGRLSLESAAQVARDLFKKECALKQSEYLGFAIEKTIRFVEYRNPSMIDTDKKAKDIAFLL